MFNAVFAQTLSQQSSLQELIKNSTLEELQGLLSLPAGTRLLYLSPAEVPDLPFQPFTGKFWLDLISFRLLF